jgi:heptaprenyl diphosphate synthase
LLLSARFGDAAIDVTEYAAIIEIIHMASLVHDDIIDDASYRRGRESVQKKYGKKIAVYAGDFMLFSAISTTNIAFDEKYRKMNKVLQNLCYGELGQNAWLYNMDITVEQYLKNITGKTASMFELACSIGGMAANAAEKIIQELTDYGKNLGVLFQIRDDLFDFQPAGKVFSKPTHQDFSNGIYTLPVIYAMEDEKCKKRLTAIKKNCAFNKKDCQEITQIIVSANGFERCYHTAYQYYAAVQKALENLPEQDEKKYLKDLAEKIFADIADMTGIS